MTPVERPTRHEKAELTVYNAGVRAREEGKTAQDCPYHDTRQLSGKLTFSRYWRGVWFRGFKGQPR